MKNSLYLLVLSIIFMSCTTDNEQPVILDDIATEGKQAFSIDFKDITASTLSDKNPGDFVPAFALISITANDGNPVFTREKIAVLKVDEKYVTEEITLAEGTYNITEFIVTDADNVVISLAPMANSPLAQLAETTLPFGFTVEPDETNITATENIEADGYTAFDFGYGEINLAFAEATDFFSLTVDESELLTTKTIVLKSLTGSSYIIDWGDGTIDGYISTISGTIEVNELSHSYNEQKDYTINISGALEVIEELEFIGGDLENNYQSNIASIDLEKLPLLKSCGLYGGKLSTLDISENTFLETLFVRNNKLTSLNLTNTPNLKTVWLDDNQLTHIDVSENLDLESLNIAENKISNLTITNNTRLQILMAQKNELSSLNISNNLELTIVTLTENFLTALDISNNLNLIQFNAGSNELMEVDVSKNTNLKYIDLDQNQISSIDLSYNTKLERLDINDNLLSDIKLSNNPEIRSLGISNNMLSNLDLSQNPWLFSFNIRGNQFDGTALDQVITQVYDHVVLNSIKEGYISFNNNPGFDGVDSSTTVKVNELINTFNWVYIIG